MKLIHIYWSALILSAVFFVMFWFAPWAYGYFGQDMQSLLSYEGYGSWFETGEWWYWGYFLATLVGYAGMFLFRKFFRWWFVIAIVIGLIMSPMFGVSILTGIEVFIIDTSTILSGLIIGLAFFSPLNEHFY